MNIRSIVKFINKITPTAVEMVLDVQKEDFYFNAGQYIWLITPVGRRAFSICSGSKDPNSIALLFKDGLESEYMKYLYNLEVGDRVSFRGPCGVLRAPLDNTNATYIAGGVGISPFLSILRSLGKDFGNRYIKLFYSNSDPDSVPYESELDRLSSEIKNFNLIKITGKVNQEILSKHLDVSSKIYVLGSDNFVNGISKLLINLKVDLDNIYFEENFPLLGELILDTNDNSFFKDIVEQTANHIIITDINGKIIYANKSAEVLTGYSFDEMKGQTPRLWGGLMDSDMYKEFWENIKIKRTSFRGEFKNVKKNGDIYYAMATVSPIFDKNHALIGFMGIEEDVTETRKVKDELKKVTDLMISEINKKDNGR